VPATRWVQSAARLAALTIALLVGADESDARPVDGVSAALRYSNTSVSSPAVAAAGATATPAIRMAAQVLPAYPGGSLSGLFNRGGILARFAAGFLGAGVIGLLFGRGISAELNGVPSYLGLIFQLALLLMLGRLIWTRWRADGGLSPAGLSPRQLADPYMRSRDDLYTPTDPFVGDDDLAEKDVPPNVRSSKLTEPRGGE